MIDQVLDQLRGYGLLVDHLEIGSLRRCDVEGDRPRSQNGWYSLFEFKLNNGKTIITGAYGTWKRAGDSQKVWSKNLGIDKEERKRINQQIAENKRIAEQARVETAASAARKAARFFDRNALAEGESEYLKRKKVKAYGVKYSNRGALVLPIRNIHGAILGIQFINAEKNDDSKDKFFWPKGVQISGGFFLIGEIIRGKPIAIAEGYATGASVHEVMGWPVVVCFQSGNLGPASKAIRSMYSDSALIICGDDDWKALDSKKMPYNAGMISAKKAALAVEGKIAFPSFKNRQEKDVDFNDLHVAEGVDAVRNCFSDIIADLSNWKERLSRSNNGTLLADPRNCYLIFSHDSRWNGVLAYCNLSYRVLKNKLPPFPPSSLEHPDNEWRADDTSRAGVWLTEHYGIDARDTVLDKVINMVAQDNAYHPVKKYLKDLRWDGKPRVDKWVINYLGVEESIYAMLAGRKWLLGAVARVMRYPVKVDNLLILEGAQGLGKSTAFKVLGGDWYADTHFSLGEKDGYEQMQGVWICELSELDSFGRAESSRAKGFFSSETDRFRPSYGRRAENFPRQCVFGGSTNQDAYFKDATGNRRYWPVLCTNIRIDELQRDRDQIWAEAYDLYKKGEIWHVQEGESHLFDREQEARLVVDAWEDIILIWVDDAGQYARDKFTLAELFMGALKMDPSQMRPPEINRLAGIMLKIGWKKVRRKKDGGNGKFDRQYYYERPARGDS